MWRITRQPRYPLRIGASRVAPAPLANRKIAFGCGRLAIRASAPRSLSRRARYPPPLARARLRCGAASRSATAQPPLVPRAASIRECGLHGLVGIPPVALQRRLAASAVRGRRIALWPRSPAPLHLRAVGTCQFSRGASVAACTAYCEPFRCFAQPWRGVMSRFLACANCHVIRGLAHQGAQCAPCQKAERAKDVAWRLGDARNVAAAFHRARPLIANGDHVPTAYSPAR